MIKAGIYKGLPQKHKNSLISDNDLMVEGYYIPAKSWFRFDYNLSEKKAFNFVNIENFFLALGYKRKELPTFNRNLFLRIVHKTDRNISKKMISLISTKECNYVNATYFFINKQNNAVKVHTVMKVISSDSDQNPLIINVSSCCLSDNPSSVSIHSRLSCIDHIKNHHFYTKLTARELEVLQHFISGYNTKDIALALIISHKTVETHLVNIKKKLTSIASKLPLYNYLTKTKNYLTIA